MLLQGASRQDKSLREKLRNIDEDGRKAIQARCADLLSRISLSCFQFLHRSMFRRHKLTLAVLFTLKVMQQSGGLHKELALALLNMDGSGVAGAGGGASGLGGSDDGGGDGSPRSRSSSRVGSPRGGAGGGAAAAAPVRPPQILEEWMTPVTWARVLKLQAEAPELARLATDIAGDADMWADWFHGIKPEEESLPAPFDVLGLESVARLAITRALRPDRLPSLLRRFVQLRMGSDYVSDEYHHLDDVLATSSAATPICFFVSPGADPLSKVAQTAAAQGMTVANGSYVSVSMGQGQEVRPSTEYQMLLQY
jgi:hypothetical protein